MLVHGCLSEKEYTYFAAVLVIRLHLHTLTEIHQGLVDLASFCECGSGRFRIPSSLRASQVDYGEGTA